MTECIRYTESMPRYIFTGAVVQWAATIRTALSLGCTAALLLGIIGLAHVGAAHSETNASSSWVDPDRFTDPPPGVAEPNLPAHTSSTRRTLSWSFLDHMARALTPDQRIQAFETIESLLHAGQFVSASKLLERFDGVILDRPQSAIWHLLKAKTLYMSGEYKKALWTLHRLPDRDLLPHHQATALWLKTGSLLGVQQIPEALKMARNFVPNTHRFVAASVYKMVWNTLRSMPRSELDKLRVEAADPHSAAWLALANLFASDPISSQNFNRQLTSWQRRYPDHPANRYVLLHIASQANSAHHRIRQVALLLPITSSFTEAAQAIRDGFFFPIQTKRPVNPSLDSHLRFRRSDRAHPCVLRCSGKGPGRLHRRPGWTGCRGGDGKPGTNSQSLPCCLETSVILTQHAPTLTNSASHRRMMRQR